MNKVPIVVVAINRYSSAPVWLHWGVEGRSSVTACCDQSPGSSNYKQIQVLQYDYIVFFYIFVHQL